MARPRPGPSRRCRPRTAIASLRHRCGTLVFFVNVICPDPDSVKRRIDFDYPLADRPRVTRRSPSGASVNRCQEAGGARDWNGERTELRCANSASVVRYRSSMACGSSNSGGAANTRLLASEMTAQIAQASAGDRYRDWTVAASGRFRPAASGTAGICGMIEVNLRQAGRDRRRGRAPGGNARTTAQTGSRARAAPAASRV